MPPDMIAAFAVLGVLAGMSVRPVCIRPARPDRASGTHGLSPLPGAHPDRRPAGGAGRGVGPVLILPHPHRRAPGVVEVLLGVVSALLAVRHAGVLVVLGFCWLAAHGAAVALIDIAVQRIPDVLAVSAYGGVTLLLAGDAMTWHYPVGLVRAALAGITLTVFYGVLSVASRGGLGMGDVKPAASLGTALGWVGIPALITGTLLGFVVGATYGFIAIVMGRSRWHQQFAFGPFLVLGTVVALLIG